MAGTRDTMSRLDRARKEEYYAHEPPYCYPQYSVDLSKLRSRFFYPLPSLFAVSFLQTWLLTRRFPSIAPRRCRSWFDEFLDGLQKTGSFLIFYVTFMLRSIILTIIQGISFFSIAYVNVHFFLITNFIFNFLFGHCDCTELF